MKNKMVPIKWIKRLWKFTDKPMHIIRQVSNPNTTIIGLDMTKDGRSVFVCRDGRVERLIKTFQKEDPKRFNKWISAIINTFNSGPVEAAHGTDYYRFDNKPVKIDFIFLNLKMIYQLPELGFSQDYIHAGIIYDLLHEAGHSMFGTNEIMANGFAYKLAAEFPRYTKKIREALKRHNREAQSGMYSYKNPEHSYHFSPGQLTALTQFNKMPIKRIPYRGR